MSKQARLRVALPDGACRHRSSLCVHCIHAGFGLSESSGDLVGRYFRNLRPPSLLSIPLFDIEPYPVGGAIFWLIIGLMNSALYAAVGSVVGRFLWKAEGPTASKV